MVKTITIKPMIEMKFRPWMRPKETPKLQGYYFTVKFTGEDFEDICTQREKFEKDIEKYYKADIGYGLFPAEEE